MGLVALPVALIAAQNPASPQRAILNRYCVTCHNDRLRTAELSLETLDVNDVATHASTWEKVAHKLRTREMPPAGVPRPDAATYDSLADYFETELDRAAEASPNPGSSAVHRMNRAEYTNAIRDLLALDIDGRTMLPPDDSGYGFDNIGDVLSMSPMLLERYLSAAARISRLAVGDLSLKPGSVSFDLPHAMMQDERMSDEMPFGSRGGMAIRHHFPLDAEYIIQVKLQRNRGGNIIGIARPTQVDIRLDGARLKLFTVGGAGDKPKSENSGLASYESTADKHLEVRFPAKAGTREVTVSFVKDTLKAEGVLDRAYDRAFFEGLGSVTILGPYNGNSVGDTASRQKIFLCHPARQSEEDACARRILSTLARQAFRRPVTDEEAAALMLPYLETKKPSGFETGIRMALQRILVSPKFLFRVERDPAGIAPGTAYRVSDLELASRLSFFLWSSIPDDELLALAELGQLKDPAVIEKQVRRMIADPRSKTLITNFVGQWLYLRNIERVLPDPEAFPDFDENLRGAFLKETELFFESMLREDRSVVDLLQADYSFLNERLAQHYGVPNVYGNDFRRVSLPDEARRGLLGLGSVLTVTSYANRTSPTLRGKWVLENLLGSPPPPPPPNVPSLKEDKNGGVQTMRERLEQHRASPACASCHARMDPLGLALENFDGLGRWRATTATPSNPVGYPIDASGVLPDGTKFNGAAGLRQVILKKKDQFVAAFTERLLTYALGRGIEYYDAPAIRRITREAAASDYRWSAMITSIVKSMPFQMSRSR
jgi:hypothetical protein